MILFMTSVSAASMHCHCDSRFRTASDCSAAAGEGGEWNASPDSHADPGAI